MFTGLIEELGQLKNIKKGVSSAVLSIAADKVLEDTKIGDSIAVNGVCLTVTGLYDSYFTPYVMHEIHNASSMSSFIAMKPTLSLGVISFVISSSMRETRMVPL